MRLISHQSHPAREVLKIFFDFDFFDELFDLLVGGALFEKGPRLLFSAELISNPLVKILGTDIFLDFLDIAVGVAL